MQSTDEMDERMSRALWLIAGSVAVFLAGFGGGRLTVRTDIAPTSAQRTATAAATNPTPTRDLPLAQGGKTSSAQIEQMAIGALFLDRFTDSAKLMNVISE